MAWFLLSLSSIGFVCIFIWARMSDHIQSLKNIVAKTGNVIRSPGISDHWKEKVLPRYALQLFLSSDVLESGVGTVRLALKMCSKCKSFTGIDISHNPVEYFS